MKTAVSIVMAVYNGRRFLPAQVSSLLADLQPSDELIVIDDASTDSTYDWFKSLNDARIRLQRNPANEGVLRSFETGLRLAQNDIIFLCDQDDDWRRGKRAAFVAEFEKNEQCLIVISDASLIDAESRTIADSFMRTRGGFRSGFWSNVFRNRYLGCAMAVHRRLLAAALPIPRHVPQHDMWLGIMGCLLGRVAYLPEPWISYRRHGNNVTRSSRSSWWQVAVWRFNLLRAVFQRLTALAIGGQSGSAIRDRA